MENHIDWVAFGIFLYCVVMFLAAMVMWTGELGDSDMHRASYALFWPIWFLVCIIRLIIFTAKEVAGAFTDD